TGSRQLLPLLRLLLGGEPAILMVNEGESVNITCSVTTKGMLVGMYLKKEVVNAMEVLYITNNGHTRTIAFRYKDRIEISVLQTDVRITLHQLQKNDTGLYVCRGSVLENYEPNCVSSQGTILVVKGICMFFYFLSVNQMGIYFQLKGLRKCRTLTEWLCFSILAQPRMSLWREGIFLQLCFSYIQTITF
uniref:Ig-like domain-containing protein n=1 Tax=Terrapene triunguis TaxID=2587831 RepID=A0A674JZ21_9SAUR